MLTHLFLFVIIVILLYYYDSNKIGDSMKNNKGFTLVEVIAVIVILAIIVILGVGIYTNVYESQKEKTYENKVSMIELSAEKWAVEANISRNMTITVNRLVESSYFQADDFDTTNKVYVVNDPRDNASMLCNTIDISIDNGEVVAKLNDVENCDLKDEETDRAKVQIAAYEYDTSTNKVTKILKSKDSILTTIPWTKKAVLLAVEPQSEYSSYKRVMFSSNGVSKEKMVSNNIMKLSNIKVGSSVNIDSYANLYLVDVNLFLKAVYNVAVDVNNVGIKSNELTVQIDKEAPTSNIINENGWTKGKKTITLRGTDGAGSGLKGFYVTTIGSGYSPKAADFKASTYEKKVDITTEGTYYAYAEDNVGNISKTGVKFDVINIDATPPTCSITVTGKLGTNSWYTGDVSFNLNYADSQSGVKTHTISANALTTDRKEYKVTGSVTDNVGNVCNTEVVVKRDATKPSISVSVSDATVWKNTNKTVKVTASDATSGIIGYYIGAGSTCNNVSYTAYDGSASLEKSVSYDNGNYIVCIKDNAGNVEGKTFKVEKIDKIAPTCGSFAGQNSSWKKGAVTITNTPTDSGGSGIANSFTQTFSSGTTKTSSVSFVAKDNAGNTKTCSATVNVYVDYDAPSCGTSWGGQSTSWTSSNRTITNTPTDTGSGIANTFSQLFSSGTTKTANVSYVAKDKVGNSRTCSTTANVYVDKQGPTCGSSWGGQSTSWTSSNRTITNTPTDSGSGIANSYSKLFDTGTTKTYAASYTAKDNVGNATTCSKTVNVYVDKDAPTCGSFTGQNSTWKNTAVTIKSTASDGGSGTTSSFSKTFNSGTTKTYAASYTATDAAGNSRNCSSTVNVYVDYDAPVCGASWVNESTSWTSSNRTITNTATDSGSGTTSKYSKTFSTTTQTEAASYTATDAAGNSKVCSKTVNVYVDKAAPTVSFVNASGTDMAAGSYSGSQTVVLKAADANSGLKSLTYKVSKDGGAATETAGSSGTKYTMSSSGKYTISVKACDNAGNCTGWVERTYTISMNYAAVKTEQELSYCGHYCHGSAWSCWDAGGCTCPSGYVIGWGKAGCDTVVGSHNCEGKWLEKDKPCYETTYSCPNGGTLNTSNYMCEF